MSSFGIALVYDALGERSRPWRRLERAYEEHSVEFARAAQYPPFQTLRTDPRYQIVMGRVGRHHQ